MDAYWRQNKELAAITPEGVRFPEGFDVIETLREMFAGQSVVEFGCGDGRLTAAFDRETYVGVDINPHAILAARRNNPGYTFHLDAFPRKRAALAYTVLLHIPDDAIASVVERLSDCCRVVVVEIMGRKWRRPGLPPVFNREPGEYETMFEHCGMRLGTKFDEPYKRYGGVNITFMSFERR